MSPDRENIQRIVTRLHDDQRQATYLEELEAQQARESETSLSAVEYERMIRLRDSWLAVMLDAGALGASPLYERTEYGNFFKRSRVQPTAGWFVDSYNVVVDHGPYGSSDLDVPFWLTVEGLFLIGNVTNPEWGGMESDGLNSFSEKTIQNLRSIAAKNGVRWSGKIGSGIA